MKNGNTTLYILIGVVALAVIGFLVMRNNETEMENEVETAMVEEATDTNDTNEAMVEETTPSNGVQVGGAMMTPDKNIVDNAVNSADHTTLVAAAQAAELVETLRGEGPFTVFAPTNAAFEKLPQGTLDELLLPENKEALTGILAYHVVPGSYTSDMITEGLQLETVNGQMLTFSKINDIWWVNNTAMITIADVVSSNGVTHVIDTVLMPAE